MTYAQKLKDPRWQRKRLEALGRDKFTCVECCDTKSTLHVHHSYYISGRDIWDYPLASLVTLCENCHENKRSQHGDPAREDWEHIAVVAFKDKSSNHVKLAGLMLVIEHETECEMSLILKLSVAILKHGDALKMAVLKEQQGVNAE